MTIITIAVRQEILRNNKLSLIIWSVMAVSLVLCGVEFNGRLCSGPLDPAMLLLAVRRVSGAVSGSQGKFPWFIDQWELRMEIRYRDRGRVDGVSVEPVCFSVPLSFYDHHKTNIMFDKQYKVTFGFILWLFVKKELKLRSFSMLGSKNRAKMPALSPVPL